jgi:hypothetical protein
MLQNISRAGCYMTGSLRQSGTIMAFQPIRVIHGELLENPKAVLPNVRNPQVLKAKGCLSRSLQLMNHPCVRISSESFSPVSMMLLFIGPSLLSSLLSLVGYPPGVGFNW